MSILFFFSFLFFETKTHLFGAGSSPRLSVACLRTMSQEISSILSLSPIHVYSLLLPTSDIYYLSFTICRFRVDTTLIWILFLVQREGEKGVSFYFLFFFFGHCNYQQILDICTDLLVFICLNIMYKFAHEPRMRLSVSPISYIPYSPFYSCPR